jgi:protein-disulfide isomerase
MTAGRAGPVRLLPAGVGGVFLLVVVAPPPPPAQDSPAGDVELLIRADTVRLQVPEAPDLVLTEFVDLACSDCRAFHLERADSLRALVAEEGLAYALRFYPIPRLLRGFHGAEALLCAGGVGGVEVFRAMQHLLFERQQEWAESFDPGPLLHDYGRQLGLPAGFEDCLRRNATWPLIASDIQQSVILRIPGTPTFVVSRVGSEAEPEMFYGNQPMARFREAIARVRAGT